jgi:hypothetical protein
LAPVVKEAAGMSKHPALALALALSSAIGLSYVACVPVEGTTGGAPQGPGTGGVAQGDMAVKGSDPGPGPGPGAVGDMAASDLAPTKGTTPASCTTPATVADYPDGHHNPGMDCLSCHSGNSPEPSPAPQPPKTPYTWAVAGTLFDTVNGNKPVAGATIKVTDKNGKTVNIPTAANGNFWISDSTLVPPFNVTATCTASNSMQGATGSCNTCHNSTFRVHTQ